MGFSNFILSASQAVLNIYMIELIKGGVLKDPSNAFKVINVILVITQELSSKLLSVSEIAKGLAAFEMINKILDRPSLIDSTLQDEEDPDYKKYVKAENIKGKIEFKDVWFRYPTRKEEFVLRGLNLTVEPGQSVALVGESGCGKSTFINLMMRFYDPQFGEILLDGRNIKEYNLHSLRQAVSLVMQEPVLFNYSIMENILYSKMDATNEEIVQVSEAANCKDFVEAQKDREDVDESPKTLLAQWEEHKDQIIQHLQATQATEGKDGEPAPALDPNYGATKYQEELDVLNEIIEASLTQGDFKYQEGDVDTRDQSKVGPIHAGFKTLCGLKGSKLSGGQKQRVAIARTLIRKPSVLLLDEATSALDEDSQQKVQDALAKAREGRTMIVIAHRMSTIKGCDKLFMLQTGKVMEEGTFGELEAAGGGFA